MAETEVLQGMFTHTIYKSSSYMVSKFKTEDGPITVTGPSFDYEEKQLYRLTGNYVDHPRYGFQFAMLTIEKILPDKKDEIISFLGSKAFKGIGRKTAEKIYEHFGEQTLNRLKENPEAIFEVALTGRQYASLQEGFENLNDPENDILFNLVSNGFNNNEAQRIFSRFKLATLEVGRDNPFRFYNDIYGIRFEAVKQYAQKIEFTDAELKYMVAYLIYFLKEYTFNSGNIFAEEEELYSHLKRQGHNNDFSAALELAIDQNYIVKEENRYYLFADYNDEKFIARYLKNFSNDLTLSAELIDEGIDSCEKQLSISYDDVQKSAIRNFFENGISFIVGGPGTGKTTIVRGMVEIFKEYFPFSNLIVVAPTGRAAKRINEICDVESKTIHSLLKWNKESNLFAYDIDNPILYDCLIIDEFSMVDNSLFASLLKAGSRIKKLCIIGDNNQLPSIKPGELLSDLLSSGMFPATELKHNHRQAEGSEIISLANDIINNDVNLSSYSRDICFYNIYERNFDLISLIKEDIRNGYSLNDIQILSPMYKGAWGIDNLNILLQDTFNPAAISKKEKKVGQFTFRIDDKILQLKNRPTDDVYNGDIGILSEIDDKEKYLMVDYAGIYVFYEYEELSDIALAYAMSVHKSQGSEYPIVYFIISKNNLRMLNRKLIYTAISRAKNKLVIIGDGALFMHGLSCMMKKRNTTLVKRLMEDG
ncbi:MAG: AAA family ATPase [Erysipelotrichaceae bacterium]|nr:AAA family ATPase [Erysipelotrichaceae bacterium]